MRNLPLLRQEGEALVDLLENNPDYVIHDKPASELAAEIRQLFGMCSREDELVWRKKIKDGPKTTMDLNVTLHETKFSDVPFTP